MAVPVLARAREVLRSGANLDVYRTPASPALGEPTVVGAARSPEEAEQLRQAAISDDRWAYARVTHESAEARAARGEPETMPPAPAPGRGVWELRIRAAMAERSALLSQHKVPVTA